MVGSQPYGQLSLAYAKITAGKENAQPAFAAGRGTIAHSCDGGGFDASTLRASSIAGLSAGFRFADDSRGVAAA
jgi:hypothetical protein